MAARRSAARGRHRASVVHRRAVVRCGRPSVLFSDRSAVGRGRKVQHSFERHFCTVWCAAVRHGRRGSLSPKVEREHLHLRVAALRGRAPLCAWTRGGLRVLGVWALRGAPRARARRLGGLRARPALRAGPGARLRARVRRRPQHRLWPGRRPLRRGLPAVRAPRSSRRGPTERAPARCASGGRCCGCCRRWRACLRLGGLGARGAAAHCPRRAA